MNQGILQRIKSHIQDNILTQEQLLAGVSDKIAQAVECIVHCLQNKHKILSCGNGGSAGDAQHFATELVNRFEREREPLAALALNVDGTLLTAIANDYNYDQIFVKQILALGQPGDVLLAISTSGNSENVLAAIKAAHSKQMQVVALTGHDGGKMPAILAERDICLCAPNARTARVQESHLLMIHCLCDLIDEMLYPVAVEVKQQAVEIL